ncbi:MAG: ATP-binding cassette domain-containing protein [Hymenobacter sp.]
MGGVGIVAPPSARWGGVATKPYLAAAPCPRCRPYPPPALRVSHLTKRYGAQLILDDISFEVAEGETLVLLGPSGCGKTTLLKTLNRLIEPDGGTIEINGQDVPPASGPRRCGAASATSFSRWGCCRTTPWCSERWPWCPACWAAPPAETAARTTALLERLHLPAARFADLLPTQLSGGQAAARGPGPRPGRRPARDSAR